MAGGLIAGLLFVLPGAAVVLALAMIYASFGSVPLVRALFEGVQAAVIVIVFEALLRVARRALTRRSHALIAFEGSRVVGYLGWSLYSIDEALAFARTGHAPADAPRDRGDVVWVTTVAANSRTVLFKLARAARAQNDGRSLMAIRVYRDGAQRVVPPTLIVPPDRWAV